MNIARVAISKVLNSDARWAPAIKNPVDVSAGQGIVYRFDTRDYWGYNKGVTKLPVRRLGRRHCVRLGRQEGLFGQPNQRE
ncbi:MAG: hypothetical protein WDO74_26510 [Pseudomonadota bacterium]